MTTPAPPAPRRARPRDDTTGPVPSRLWGWWAAATGLVILLAGLFLLVTYVLLLLDYGAGPWGRVTAGLSAGGNLMLAALIPYASRRAARAWAARVAVWLVAAAALAAAAAGLLAATGQLGREAALQVIVGATALQMLWLLWVGRRYARDDALPRDLARLALVFPLALLLAGALAGASLLVPPGPWWAPLLLGSATVLAGVTWLMWPLWLVLLGRHLLGRRRRRPGPTGIAEAAR